jgi:hypothetical protein
MIGDQPTRWQMIRVTREKSDWPAGAWVFPKTVIPMMKVDSNAHVPAGEHGRRLVNVNGPEEMPTLTPITVNPGSVTCIKLGAGVSLSAGSRTKTRSADRLGVGSLRIVS